VRWAPGSKPVHQPLVFDNLISTMPSIALCNAVKDLQRAGMDNYPVLIQCPLIQKGTHMLKRPEKRTEEAGKVATKYGGFVQRMA